MALFSTYQHSQGSGSTRKHHLGLIVRKLKGGGGDCTEKGFKPLEQVWPLFRAGVMSDG